MTTYISGFGLQVRLIASTTFPAGITITQFADDTDPFDQPSIKVAEATTGLNGDLIIASKGTPLPITLGVIPNSQDDRNLAILLEANRTAKGKNPARDRIQMTALYPDGSTQLLTEGAITDGPAGNSVASAGRFKSKSYIFAFENRVITGIPSL